MMNSNIKAGIPCMNNIPFIPASLKSSCKSYSIFANVQQVFSLMKHHNVRRCSICKKKKYKKNMELKRILEPEFFNPGNIKRNMVDQRESFQSFCSCSESLIKLLQLYNKEYEKNIIIYKELLCDINEYVKNNNTEKINETENKILKLYQYLKKKSDEMLMIKYIIESIPNGSIEEKSKNTTTKNTTTTTTTTTTKPKVSFSNTNNSNTKTNSNSNSNNYNKRKGSIVNTGLHPSSSFSNINSKTYPHWEKINSLSNYSIKSSIKKDDHGYPKSTLELLRFSQKIQEFLSQEHYLRST